MIIDRTAPQQDLHMLTTRVLPVLRALIRAGYFSLEIEGAEHVPRQGATVFAGNHAGWFTLDSLMGILALAEHVGVDRLPFGAVQDELLKTPWLGRFFEKVGGFPASWLRNARGLPPEMQVFMVYPEGTEGNCKPFWRAYRMRQWMTGFVRLAAVKGAVVVPVAILGGEECLPVASTLRFLKPLVGTILPMPLCMFPLPSRWKFVFHKPIEIEDLALVRKTFGHQAMEHRCQEISAAVRAVVQETLDRETSNRVLARLARLLERKEKPGTTPFHHSIRQAAKSKNHLQPATVLGAANRAIWPTGMGL